ncbi:MAG: hypothetical protein ABI409_05040 [Ramlibacter sp.]
MQFTPVAVAAVLTLAALPSWPAPGAAPLRVQLVEIVDSQGFERPMRAFSVMLPVGFKYEGKVAWSLTAGGCQRPFSPRLQAQAADGQQAIALLAGEGWGRSSFGALSPGCPMGDIASAEGYLRHWVQRQRPGARWIGWQPRPDLVAPPSSMDMGGGGGMRSWHEAGRATIAYTHEGRPVQEILAVIANFTATTMASLPGQPPMQMMTGESVGMLSWRAPEGQLDPKQFDAVWSSLRSDPAWSARVQQGMNQMAQDNARTQAQISQIQAETGRQTIAEMGRRGQMAAQTRAEIAGIQQQGFDNRMASQDRQQTETVKAIRGVEHWRADDGKVVELPSQYPHAWKLKDGSYLLTDSPAFDPGRDLGIEGEKMQRTR